MPVERRDRSVSADRSRASPLPCSSSRSRPPLPKNALEKEENMKDWEDARCPVCMEHPHNAILLLCSSHEKGCRPFMCDTSYRHSNCFDQFRKSFAKDSQTMSMQEDVAASTSTSRSALASVISAEATASDSHNEISEEGSTSTSAMSVENQPKPKLMCPLCRGQINGWIVVESARQFMNAKSRSCASEACDFSGAYSELRKHARTVHPCLRPTEADPERQRNWRRLERQRDWGDLLSSLQASMGEERSEESPLTFDEGGWLTVFFLVRILRPGSTSRSTSWSGVSRATAQVTLGRRSSRRLWGEQHNGGAEARDEDNESSEDEPQPRRRSRRRTTPDEDNESSEGEPQPRRRLRRRTTPEN